MKRLIIILVLVFPIALSPDCSIALSPMSTASAATLTPQQKAAKKRAAEREKAAKQRAKAKEKAAKQRAKAKAKSKTTTTTKTVASPHSVIVWGEVGYSALFSTLNQAQVKGGVGGGAGLGYQLDYNRWMLVAGAEFTYLTSTMTIPDYTLQKVYTYVPASTTMTYTHNYSQIGYYDQVGLVQIPLRFGYRFTDNWYGLLGLNVGFGVLGSSQYSAKEYVFARDEQFAEDFHNIGHLTGTIDYADKVTYQLGCTLAPAMEVGYQFNDYVRLGVFAEYGFVLGETAGPIQCKSDLLVGARVTASFNVPKKMKKPQSKPQPQPQPQPQQQPQPQPQVVEPVDEPIVFGEQVVEKEHAIVLENLLFVFDRADIIPESTASLDQLLSLLQAHPDMRINIIGHTDIRGSAAYNQRLSEQRAKAVMDYLTDHGIEADRLRYEGRGAMEPVDSNDTEEGRQHNRRVEFVVL